jgi:hypothetical protein
MNSSAMAYVRTSDRRRESAMAQCTFGGLVDVPSSWDRDLLQRRDMRFLVAWLLGGRLRVIVLWYLVAHAAWG